ncbi:MAG: helix-turn-helix transcriptional regulator [Candidatus Uhrbacteria bacterium]|nr:helix-turn-helix transcriptional regulator [Candidatus Uhrbacteria bacterium]
MSKNIKKNIETALSDGRLISFEQIMSRYTKKEKDAIAEHARYLKAAIELRKLRKQLGLSQSSLANKMKVRREFISRIESGTQNITLETLYRVGEVTGKQVAIMFK